MRKRVVCARVWMWMWVGVGVILAWPNTADKSNHDGNVLVALHSYTLSSNMMQHACNAEACCQRLRYAHLTLTVSRNRFKLRLRLQGAQWTMWCRPCFSVSALSFFDADFRR